MKTDLQGSFLKRSAEVFQFHCSKIARLSNAELVMTLKEIWSQTCSQLDTNNSNHASFVFKKGKKRVKSSNEK